MGELNWYGIRVISGQEKKVKTYLENEFGIPVDALRFWLNE